jgi:hypothetical protein
MTPMRHFQTAASVLTHRLPHSAKPLARISPQRGINMSVVIIGGNECMERQYIDTCKKHGCKAKVFCKYKGGLACRIGSPDLMIVFTHTVSHKMVQSALSNVTEETNVVRSHKSSLASLQNILMEYAAV